MTDLTEKQTAAIEKIKAEILTRKYGHTSPSYEIKEFRVTMPISEKGIAFVFVTTGLIKDEGTYAAIFARDHRHVLVGPMGGVELLNPKKRGRTINRGFFHVFNNLTNY